VKRARQLIAAFAIATLLSCAQTSTGEASSRPRVLLETELGQIEIVVHVDAAPDTAENFLHYVDAGFYDQGRFLRAVSADSQPDGAVPLAAVQADINPNLLGQRRPSIRLERTSVTGLRHLDGTVSMARTGTDTAASSFFICIGDQASLDYGGAFNPDGQGFAAFGQVVRGLDVVRRIQASGREQQNLITPVSIVTARRIR
jgi:peptidyl-prolyl cis-trans isomerase A (cyclophilin A)